MIQGQKTDITDLAIFGGAKLFEKVRPIGQLATPDKGDFFSRLHQIIDSRRLTNNGSQVAELEASLAKIHHCKHCIAVTSASFAIIILLKLLCTESSRNKVIMPALTYTGLPYLARWAGLQPLFCDVDLNSHTLSVAAVKELIDENTAAILGVHHVNSPCHVEELESLAASHGVPIFFDSVHRLGATNKGKPVGSFGSAEIFSLHATKLINGFEGGYITTNDAQLAAEIRNMINFGFNEEGNISTLGLNAKLNEIHAAMASANLVDLPELIEHNYLRYRAYKAHLDSLDEACLVKYCDDEKHNYEFSLLEINSENSNLSRDEIVELLRAEGALARPYYSPPLHKVDPWCDMQAHGKMTNTEHLADRIIQLPVGEHVSLEDIHAICILIKFIFLYGKEISLRLHERKLT